MNPLNTLYFPATAINSPRLYPIFLLFQNVHLLSPVEDGQEPPDSFINSGFCQVHTPCPLGQERDRFLRLVADIKSGKDDYAAQLSALTLAAMTGDRAQSEEDSERSIVRSLHGSQERTPQVRERQVLEKLWQARLVLAMGELLDQEEEEISVNLALLDDEEKELFKELQGEDEKEEGEENNPFADLTQLEGSLRVNSASNIKKRFQAWRTLFLAGEIEDCGIFLTSGAENGDLLLEMYQQQTGQQAALIERLELPALIGWNAAEARDTVRAFTTKNAAFLSTLHGHLADFIDRTTTPGQALEPAAEQLAQAGTWAKSLAADFPAERFGRIPVSFYLFPGLPCAQLIGKASVPPHPGKNGLLAVVG